jgi:hypothetical protein
VIIDAGCRRVRCKPPSAMGFLQWCSSTEHDYSEGSKPHFTRTLASQGVLDIFGSHLECWAVYLTGIQHAHSLHRNGCSNCSQPEL